MRASASFIMQRNHTLDVLRGVLAWAVVMVHVAWVSGIQGQTQHNIGVMAVEGFIILTGYVITQLILIKREKYGTFIFRRFMGLFPIFVVCLLISLAVRPLTLGAIPGPDQPLLEANENHFFWQHIVAHLTMLHGIIPSQWLPTSQIAFLVPAWSISLEFQLYLVAPLLIWWLSRSGLRGALYVVVPSLIFILAPVSSRVSYIWSGAGGFLPQKFIFFLAGALIYLFSTKGPQKTMVYQYWSWFIRLGEVSYSTYLVHYPVLSVVTRFVPRDWSRWEKAVVIATVSTPVILLLSFFLYRYIEKPGIALGKRLSSCILPLRTDLPSHLSAPLPPSDDTPKPSSADRYRTRRPLGSAYCPRRISFSPTRRLSDAGD
jgi:peptidoglycan/LPS O-acetylase OafA/YrhL